MDEVYSLVWSTGTCQRMIRNVYIQYVYRILVVIEKGRGRERRQITQFRWLETISVLATPIICFFFFFLLYSLTSLVTSFFGTRIPGWNYCCLHSSGLTFLSAPARFGGTRLRPASSLSDSDWGLRRKEALSAYFNHGIMWKHTSSSNTSSSSSSSSSSNSSSPTSASYSRALPVK